METTQKDFQISSCLKGLDCDMMMLSIGKVVKKNDFFYQNDRQH